MDFNDFIIPLAWPEAPVRTAGGPYDKFLEKFKLYKNGYYKAGHAAFLLVNSTNGEVDYFDFGRYISPDKNGRARSKHTDPEVALEIKAIVKNGEITNFEDILLHISNHNHTHGDGTLYAGIQKKINYDRALEFINQVQAPPYLPYGPFVVGGTNCSRFVAQTIAYAKKGKGWKFVYPWYFTPAPLGNIFYSSEKKLYKVKNNTIQLLQVKGERKQFNFMKEIMMFKPNETTPDASTAHLNKVEAPKERLNASEKAQWLGGIGAGAWYEITETKSTGIKVKRVQGNGHIDFDFWFEGPTNQLDTEKPYKFLFGSHGKNIIIKQGDNTINFYRK